MNKSIIIALLTVLLFLSVGFGFYQMKEARRFEALAIENKKIANEAAFNAEKQMKLAREQAQLAAVVIDYRFIGGTKE